MIKQNQQKNGWISWRCCLIIGKNIAIQEINGPYKFRWQAATDINENHVQVVCKSLFSWLFVFVECKIINRQNV